jgi:23S rRNA (pseudouridine1915-N3)-methyltransferase
MRLIVAAVGRLKSGPERDLAVRYAERAAQTGRALGWRGPDLIEIAESKARRPDDRKAEEARDLRAALPPDAVMIALDERGRSLSSDDFAASLSGLRQAATPALAFLIGGADGLDPALARQARQMLSFGAATLPHQIVRVILLEQLYRAGTILTGHPYHRA